MENRMIKILAIDDNQDNLVTLKALVTDIFPDARMLMATSGARGLEIATSEKPDVILLDVIMPGMDGFEVCRKLKADKELHDIPVVFVTAIKGDKESRIRALESGAEAFLSKPIDETELTAQIRAMLKINSANLDKRNEKERLSALVEERTRELQEKNILTINLLEDLRTEVEARKKTELELRISEEKFSKSFYTSPDSIIINRLDNGKIVDVNDGFKKMMGYEESEVIGKTTLELNIYVNPEERNTIIHELKTNGQIEDFECWFADKNGLPILGLLSAVIIDINGIKHILSTTRDITERKQAEQSLKISEERFELAMKASSDGLFDWNLETNDIYYAPAWKKMLGYEDQEINNDFSVWEKITDPEDVKKSWELQQKLITRQTDRFVLEFKMKHKDGHWVDILSKAEAIFNEDGKAIRIVGTHTDISQRKRAEAALRDSEKRNRGILANLDAGVVIHAPDTSIILCNPKAAELLGLSELQMQGKLAVDPGWHFIDEHNKPLPLSEYPVNQIKSHKSILKQFIIGVCRPVTGDVVWLMVNGFPVLDKNGEISEILISFIDLTDRKQAADLLQKSEEKYRAIFENVQDVFYQTDLAGTIVEISPSVYNLCEYKREELIGCKASVLYNKPDERGLLVNAILLNGELWDYELELKTKSGEIKIVSINARLIKDNEGRPTHIDGAIRDITERKQAEEEARNIGLHYQAIIEKAPDGIVLINAEGNFKFVSPAAKKMFGYQLSEEPVGNPAQFTHPDDVQQVVKELALIIQDPLYTTTLQYRYKDINGNWRWVESTFSNLLADPNVEAIVINFRDINDRKLAEAELKESEQFSRYLLQTIPFGMNIVDEKGNILFQSDNLKKLCGEQATGNKCWEQYRDDKKQCVDCPLNEGIKVGTTDVYESTGVLGGKTFEITHTGIIHKGRKAMLEIFVDITGRKQAEQELIKAKESAEESEEKFRTLSENSPAIIYRVLLKPSLRFDYVSPAATEITGYTPEDHYADPDLGFKLVHPEDRVILENSIHKTNGEPIILRWLRKDGKTIWTEQRNVLIFDKAGNPYAIEGISTDITAQKEAEAKFAFQADMLSQISEAVIATDLNGAITYWNKSAEKLYGWKPEEVIGKNILEVTPTSATKEQDAEIFNSLSKGQNWTGEFSVKNKEGYSFPVIVNDSPLFDSNHKLTGVISISSDITTRRQAEQELIAAKEKAEESEAYFRNIFENSPVGKSITGMDGSIKTNKAFSDMLGYNFDEFQTKKWSEITHPDDIQKSSDAFEALLTGDEAVRRFEKRYIHKNGSIIFADIITTLQRSDTGKPLFFLSSIIDITERKKTELLIQQNNEELLVAKENAEESEAKYRLAEIDLLEAQQLANIGSWHWNLKTGLVTWSKELYNINGHNPDIPVPAFADMASYYTPESWKVINEAVARTFTTGEPYNLDFEMVKTDGTVIFANTRGCAYYDEAGEMVNLHGTVQDITERKQLEDVHAFLSTSGYPGSNETFFESLAKYLAQILDSEYVCIDKLEGDGLTAKTVAIYNEGKFDANVSYTLRQTPCGDVVGKTICCFPENVCQLFPQDEALQELKAHSYIGTTLWSFDGKPIGLIAIIGQKPLKNTSFAESVLKLVAIRAAGELERKQAAEKLLRSQKELIRAQQITHIGSWYLEVATNQVLWTEELYKMYDFDPALPPPPYTEHQKLFTAESWETLSSSIARTRETGIPYELELKTVKADGSNGWMWVRGETEQDREGKTTGLWGAAQDITERKLVEVELLKAREHAEESDRLKSAFLANMSHEIRTPMNGILGFAELLKMPGLTGEQQQEYIRIIEKSGSRMLNIINNIVDISKIESGQMTINLTETNINESLEFVCNFFEPEARSKGVDILITHKLPAEQAVIRTDREKIYAILTNLIKNAIKFSDTGTIRIGALLKGKFLEFFVTDKGIGIPFTRQQAIFERFIQADISDKRAFQGAGLGLSISKAYAEMLGGKIWVDSVEKVGSTFYFSIPYKTIAVRIDDSRSFSPADLNLTNVKKLKVLVVEDDETSQQLVTLAVKKISKEILTVNSGLDAVKICRKTPDIDLILMDIKMPLMDGYEATQQIRRFNKDTVIIAQTAFGLSGDKEKAIAAGCNGYISKPLNIAMLTKLIQTHFNMF